MRKALVFPVRYVAGKRLEDTFARELSETGISVLSGNSPRAGTIIGLQLFLPGGAAPCAVTGVVGAERVDGELRSFWAEFTGLTIGSNAVIGELLNAAQRSSRRPAVNFKVTCRVGEAVVYELAENISAGGVFVRARVKPPIDAVIEAHLELPDGKPPVKVHGRVAHASQRGFGLQFLAGEQGFRERVGELVARLTA